MATRVTYICDVCENIIKDGLVFKLTLTRSGSKNSDHVERDACARCLPKCFETAMSEETERITSIRIDPLRR